MPAYDFSCKACGHIDCLYLTLTDYERYDAKCPKCGEKWERAFIKAPVGRVRSEAGDIKKLHDSLNTRFKKSGEMDDIRHKHGEAFDDSLRGAEVKRIKDGLSQ